MFLLYSLLFTLGVILTAPYYLWRLRGNIAASGGWRERFGFLPESLQQPRRRQGAGSIWIHAVSVGETLAVAGLVEELKRRYPERKIFMSHVTPAGRETGEKQWPTLSALGDNAGPGRTAVAGRFYLPLDWQGPVRRVLARIQPDVLVIVETELWPNLVREAHRFGTRIVVVNARLSDRSFRGYRRLEPFMRRILSRVDAICAQTPRDAERFRRLGAPPERVATTGNLKFDGRPPELGPLPRLLGRALKTARRGPVMVAASTMPGEEKLVLRAWNSIRNAYPEALLILAPRHPVRFEAVSEMLAAAKISFVRRTAIETAEDEMAQQMQAPEVLLLNTLGELAGIMELADLVFVGGSLVPTGGHNLLEPAYWAKPILFGPYMNNFRDIAALFLEARAALQVRSSSELARESLELLADVELARLMGQLAKRLLEKESGATGRVLDRLGDFIEVEAATRV